MAVERGDIPDLRDSKTFENLQAAFAADTQDAARYSYFAGRAELEGHLEVAQLFRAAATSESTHAQGHLDFLRFVSDPQSRATIGSSEQNLKVTISRAEYESETMYVGFARTAREEGFDALGEWFETLALAEQRHLNSFRRALANLENATTTSLGSGGSEET